MADTTEPEAGSIPVVEDGPVSRREFLRVGLVGIVGLLLLWAPGCGSSQDGGGSNRKKDNKGNGGGGGGGY